MSDTIGKASTTDGRASGGATAPAGVPSGAMFTCASCGHSQSLPEQLLGRQVKCPHCGQVGQVVRPPLPEREPDVNDVTLDDLVTDEAAGQRTDRMAGQMAGQAAYTPGASTGSMSLEPMRSPVTMGDHLRYFFSGSIPLNLLSGLLGGVHQCLVCLALALLAFSLTDCQIFAPHSLQIMLLPALLGSLLLALNGRLSVAVCGPEPSVAVSMIVLLGALCTDIGGRLPRAAADATFLAALSLAGIMAGVFGVYLSRRGLPERMRFLPPEVLGGMLAGFGLLLVKAWFGTMLAVSPQLSTLNLGDMAALGAELARTVDVWGPPVGFALAYFVVHMALRGPVWPLLLTALCIGGWNALRLNGAGLPPAAASVLAAQTGLPQMLDPVHLYAFFDPQTLTRIHWPILAGRLEHFAALIAVAVLPSVVRTPILESVLDRDADHEEQMRLVGGASLLSGLLGALPASLSLSGSLGLRALGATAPLAGFTVGLACLGMLLAGQPLLPYIPLFVPLGILLATGLIMPVSWLLRDSRNPLTRKDDLRAAWTACLLVVLLGPVLGVFLTLALGLMLTLSRSVTGGAVRSTQTGDVYHSNVDRSPTERRILREQGRRILVLRLQGHLFLGSIYSLIALIRSRLDSMLGMGSGYVLLDFGAVTGLGASSAIGFRRLESLARRRGLVLFLTSVPFEVEEHLEPLGWRMDAESGVCRLALNLDYALEWCEDDILSGAEDRGADGQQHCDTLEEMLAASFPEPKLVPALMKCLERAEVPRKTAIIKQGAPSDSMYFLQSGKVHVELTLPGGKLLRLKKMGPGTVFGEMGLYTSAPRSASVITLERCVIYKLSTHRFELIQDKAPQLAAAVNRFVVTLLADRVAEENAKTRASQL